MVSVEVELRLCNLSFKKAISLCSSTGNRFKAKIQFIQFWGDKVGQVKFDIISKLAVGRLYFLWSCRKLFLFYVRFSSD